MQQNVRGEVKNVLYGHPVKAASQTPLPTAMETVRFIKDYENYKVEDVAKAEYAKARGLFVDIDHPQAGKLSYVRAPGRFSETPWVNRRAAPLLGEHNQEVYCGRLGYSLQELATLRGTGII